jgi:hypothetical protein
MADTVTANPWVARLWIQVGLVFMGLSAFALGLEARGLVSSTDDFPPLTELVVEYVPGWVTMGVTGALLIFSTWLFVHFARRMPR